jgi:hypothetical protein
LLPSALTETRWSPSHRQLPQHRLVQLPQQFLVLDRVVLEQIVGDHLHVRVGGLGDAIDVLVEVVVGDEDDLELGRLGLDAELGRLGRGLPDALGLTGACRLVDLVQLDLVGHARDDLALLGDEAEVEDLAECVGRARRVDVAHLRQRLFAAIGKTEQHAGLDLARHEARVDLVVHANQGVAVLDQRAEALLGRDPLAVFTDDDRRGLIGLDLGDGDALGGVLLERRGVVGVFTVAVACSLSLAIGITVAVAFTNVVDGIGRVGSAAEERQGKGETESEPSRREHRPQHTEKPREARAS